MKYDHLNLKDTFIQIAKDLDGKLSINDNAIVFDDGSHSPDIRFNLNITYKENLIRVSNITGTVFSGRIEADIAAIPKEFNFEIETVNNFELLFPWNNERLKISTKNKSLERFLKQNKPLYELKKIAEDTLFEPYIFGKFDNGSYVLTTEYSLQFKNWFCAVEPLVHFYKSVIDWLEEQSKH